jgi:NADH-quinone oxidoreductase subunit E
VKRSMDLYEAIHEKLQLDKETGTTPDMLFTMETVHCLGACGLAPAMVVNDEVFGQVTPERAVAIIDDIIQKEAGNESDNPRA